MYAIFRTKQRLIYTNFDVLNHAILEYGLERLRIETVENLKKTMI